MKTSMEIPRQLKIDIGRLPKKFTYTKLLELGVSEAKKITRVETAKMSHLEKIYPHQ